MKKQPKKTSFETDLRKAIEEHAKLVSEHSRLAEEHLELIKRLEKKHEAEKIINETAKGRSGELIIPEPLLQWKMRLNDFALRHQQ